MMKQQRGRLSEVVGEKKRDSHSIVWTLHVHCFSIGIQHFYIHYTLTYQYRPVPLYVYIYIYKQNLPVDRKIAAFPLFLHGTN